MMTPFKAVLVTLARLEWLAWRKFSGKKIGTLTESDPQVKDRLKAYYKSVGYAGSQLDTMVNDAASDKIPWSAAFISYLFATAGAGAAFPMALAHSKYVTELKGRMAQDPTVYPFQAWPLSLLLPEVGDVICVWRDADPDKKGVQQPKIHGKKVSYDAIDSANWQHFAAHCDLIVGIDGKKITAIGGNVGNTVAETIYKANIAGFVEHPRGIALIKNFK